MTSAVEPEKDQASPDAAREEADTPTLVVAVESRPGPDGEWVRRASTPAIPGLVFEAPTLTDALAMIDDAISDHVKSADSSWYWLHFRRVPPEALQRPAWRARYEQAP
jgi:predicted RNase H-like HicB family nuclease